MPKVSAQGSVDIQAQLVLIDAARETSQDQQTTRFKQSGVTVTLSNPVVDAVQKADQMQKAASQTQDSRMKALAAMTTVLAANNAYSEVMKDPSNLGGVSLSVSVGTNTYNSKSSSMGVGVTLCIPPLCTGSSSANVSLGKTRINSNFASVAERTGIQAGDQGFQLSVAGKTDLQGAVIASTNKAVDDGKNSLNTQGLSLSNIDNKAEFKAQAYSVNVGTSAGQSSAGFGKSNDQAASTTTAGVSGIAGDTSVRTGDQQQGIATIFDKDKVSKDVNAQVTITAEFGKQAAKAVGDYGQSKTKPIDDANERRYLDALAQQGPLNEAQSKRLAQLDEQGMTSSQAAANLSAPQLKQDYENWKEGGTYRVALHTVAGGLNGGLGGALGAGVSARAAPGLNELQSQLQSGLEQAGVNASVAKGLASLAGNAAATTLGGVIGGGAGAASSLNQDANNRQLHPKEIDWIKQRAKAFAKDQGISEKEATERLTRQALKEVDYLWRAQLGDGTDAPASRFLASTGQTFSNDLGDQQKLFTAPGQQLFRPEMFADVASPAFYKQFAQSGIQRNLEDGLRKELRDSGIATKDAAINLAKAAKDNPALLANAVWEAVKNLPQSVVDGLKESGTAIGEGAAVAGNQELSDKLNAIYGTDVSAAQRTLLAIRLTTAVTGAAGVAKAGGELSEATAKAIGKKLDEVAAAKEAAKDAAAVQAKVKVDNNAVRDGSLADPGRTMSPTGAWKPAQMLAPAEADARVQAYIPKGAIVTRTESADALNAAVIKENINFKPPYIANTEAVIFKTSEPADFVRVYVASGKSGQVDTWMMPSAEVKGLTPEQIASKYALPQVPTHITDVKVPAGVQMRATSRSSPIAAWVAMAEGVGCSLRF